MPRKKTNLTMPVLALRGLMVFPHMVLHFDVGRPKSVAALQEAMMNDQKIFLVAQKDVDDPDPTPENLCTVGTIANIRQVMNLPGDSLRVLVEGETRGELTAVTQEDPFLLGRIHLPKVTEPEDEMELAALVRQHTHGQILLFSGGLFGCLRPREPAGQPGDDCVHPGCG